MSTYVHTPVMLSEVLATLRPERQGNYFDGTVGGAGHADAILARSAPNGRLVGCDRDGAAIEAAQARLAGYAGRFELRQGTFAEVAATLAAESLEGALLDLGVSSAQLDQAERGFSFQADGPLDMRMDRRQGLTAARWLAEAEEEEMARAFWELGGERRGRLFARGIVEARRYRALETTGQLAGLVERWAPRRGAKIHPATRLFQALRMVVNDELGELERGLATVWGRVKIGGRLAVLTFHSGEDRVVKEFGRRRALPYEFPGAVDVPALRQPREPELRIVTRKALTPGAEEMAANPRSRSTQLRVYERLRYA